MMQTENSKRKFAVIDTETDPFNHGDVPEPFIFGFYSEDLPEKYLHFFDKNDFLNFCSEWDGDIYAHNGGKFDFFFWLERLIGADIFVINGRLSKFKIGKCTMLDSINILPLPQKKLCKMKNFEYWKMHKDHRDNHIPEIIEYLRSDCELLYPFIENFRNKYGEHITIASASMKFWLSKFYKKEFKKSDEQYFKKFRHYYYGGRTECFKKGSFTAGQKPIKYMDINSAYPYVMSNLKHPASVKYSAFFGSKNHNDDDMLLQFYHVYCDSYGALPIRDEKTKKLSYPHIKNHEFFITGHELKAGLETNTIKNLNIIKYYKWNKYIDFKEYINHFYELKKRSVKKSPDYIISKLFMNSLYGKFCTNPEKYKEYHINYIDYPINQERSEKQWVEGNILDDDIMIFERKLNHFERRKKYINVATGASITGAVRAMLWRKLCECIGNYYCDTDSIMCDDGNFDISNELGAWGIDGEIIQLNIAGKKLYSYLDKDGNRHSRSKGSQVSYDDVKKICESGEVEWKNEAPNFSMAHPHGFFTSRTIRKT